MDIAKSMKIKPEYCTAIASSGTPQRAAAVILAYTGHIRFEGARQVFGQPCVDVLHLDHRG